MLTTTPLSRPHVLRNSTRCRVSVVATAQIAPGTKVKVNKSVVVYHAPKHKDGLDLNGKEGTVLADVRQYKGEELSANLPYKTQIALDNGDGKPGKLIVHLAEHELEVV